jgi:hypothetical protein
MFRRAAAVAKATGHFMSRAASVGPGTEVGLANETNRLVTALDVAVDPAFL